MVMGRWAVGSLKSKMKRACEIKKFIWAQTSFLFELRKRCLGWDRQGIVGTKKEHFLLEESRNLRIVNWKFFEGRMNQFNCVVVYRSPDRAVKYR